MFNKSCPKKTSRQDPHGGPQRGPRRQGGEWGFTHGREILLPILNGPCHVDAVPEALPDRPMEGPHHPLDLIHLQNPGQYHHVRLDGDAVLDPPGVVLPLQKVGHRAVKLDGAELDAQFRTAVGARPEPIQVVVLDRGDPLVAAHDRVVVGGKGGQAVLLGPVPGHQHQDRGLCEGVNVALDDPGVLG